MRFDWRVAALLALSGCSTHQVTLRHVRPLSLESQQCLAKAQNLYVTVKAPPRSAVVMPSAASGLFIQAPPEGPDPALLVESLADELQATGFRLGAFRVDRSTAPVDPFSAPFAPSATLAVRLSAPALRAQEQTLSGDAAYELTKSTQPAAAWSLAFEQSAGFELTAAGGERLARHDEIYVEKTTVARDGEAMQTGYREAGNRLFASIGRQWARGFCGITTEERTRTLYKEADGSTSPAYEAAMRGRWDEAERLWRERLATSSATWRDAVGFGIASERRGDYAAAQRAYAEARDKASQEKEPPKIAWDRWLADVAQPLPAAPPVSPGLEQWFGRRLAVLPFSDDTTSIDGPVFVRHLVRERLAKAGYAVLTIDETDKVLRDHGFSQGGQLTAAHPKQLAGWLGVDRLLYGHLDDFNAVTLGVYNKRAVDGTLRLWDRETGKDLWSAHEKTMTTVVPAKLTEAGAAFVGSLVGKWVDHARHKPLEAEADAFTRQALESLPQRR